MRIKILVTIFIAFFLAFYTTGCYTVLMRPGSAWSESNQVENSQNAYDPEDSSERYDASEPDYFYLPYFGDNSPPPSAFIFYYSTAWWDDSYNNYIETSSDNSLPDPRNFIRHGANAGTGSATTVTSGSSGSGGSSAVLTKKSGDTSSTTSSDDTTSGRQTDERREISRRQSPESSQTESDSKLKRKK